jgi:hypothetical protein
MLLGLPHLEVAGWGGIYSHQSKYGRWRSLLAYGAPDSPVCTGHCPVRQPRHQAVGALTVGPAWMSGGALDRYCRVSGAPLRSCLTSARSGAH